MAVVTSSISPTLLSFLLLHGILLLGNRTIAVVSAASTYDSNQMEIVNVNEVS